MMATVKNFCISWKQQCVNFGSYSDCCGFKRDKSTYGAGEKRARKNNLEELCK
jgi:hypothetical protein